MKKDRGGLQSRKKMEMLLIVLIGVFLTFKLKQKLHMDDGTIRNLCLLCKKYTI